MKINNFTLTINDYIDHLKLRHEILIKQNRFDDAEAIVVEGEAFNKTIENHVDFLSVKFPENGIVEMIHAIG